MNAVASASISCCSITCSACRITSVESEAFSASSTSSRADWDRAIVWFSFESSLVGSYEASHGGSSTFRSQAGSYTTTGDVTDVRALSCHAARSRAAEHEPQDGRIVARDQLVQCLTG